MSPTVDARAQIGKLGGLDNVLRLLTTPTSKPAVVENALLLLAVLTHEDDELQAELISKGGIGAMIGHLGAESTATSQGAAVRSVANCTCCADAPTLDILTHQVASSDGMARLVGLLRDPIEPGSRVVECSTLALGNLLCESVVLRERLREIGGIAVLVEQLKHSESNEVVENVANALANATESNPANSDALCRCEGIAPLLDLIRLKHRRVEASLTSRSGDDASLLTTEAAALALANVAAQSAESCAEVLRLSGVQLCVALLSSRSSIVLECAAGILASCASCGLGSDTSSIGVDSARVCVPPPPPTSPVRRSAKATRSRTCGLLCDSGVGALLPLTRLGGHDNDAIRNAVHGSLKAIRSINGSSGDALMGLIEQGCVPVLHTLSAASGRVSTRAFASGTLSWLRSELDVGQTLGVLSRTLRMHGNEDLRGHIATALVHLCSVGEGDDRIKDALLSEDGGLDAVTSMLRRNTPQGRAAALDFFFAVEALMPERDDSDGTVAAVPPDSELLSLDNFNNAAHSDVRFVLCGVPLLAGEDGGRVSGAATRRQDQGRGKIQSDPRRIFYGHRAVLHANSTWFQDFFDRAAQGRERNVSSVQGEQEFELRVDVPYDIFVLVMRYIYYPCSFDLRGVLEETQPKGTSESDAMSLWNLPSVLRAAHFFRLRALHSECCLLLRQGLSGSNVLAAFEAAMECTETDDKDAKVDGTVCVGASASAAVDALRDDCFSFLLEACSARLELSGGSGASEQAATLLQQYTSDALRNGVLGATAVRENQ